MADFAKITEHLAQMDAEEKAEGKHPSVLPELRDLLDDLSTDSQKILEKSILAEGIRDALTVWKEKNAIIDGHNRLTIAKKHNLPYKIEEKSFPDVEAVRSWMIENQLGRRNLAPERFTYFLGTLYNKQKQNEPGQVGGVRAKTDDGKTTAEKIGEKFNVAERTVRRAGEVALGIDKLEQIRGRIAKAEQLSGKGQLNNEELTELGKVKSNKVADIMVKKLSENKTKKQEVKKQVQQANKAAAKAPVKYGVVFAAPNFDDLSYSVSTQPKPPMADDSICYINCQDHQVQQAIDLMNKWGFEYEGSFIYYGSTEEAGTYSKLVHEFLLIGTKGMVIGPKKGKEFTSVQKINGISLPHILKLIEAYHPDAKKLGHNGQGWDEWK